MAERRKPNDYLPGWSVEQKNHFSLVQCHLFNIMNAAKPGEQFVIRVNLATGKVERIDPPVAEAAE